MKKIFCMFLGALIGLEWHSSYAAEGNSSEERVESFLVNQDSEELSSQNQDPKKVHSKDQRVYMQQYWSKPSVEDPTKTHSAVYSKKYREKMTPEQKEKSKLKARERWLRFNEKRTEEQKEAERARSRDRMRRLAEAKRKAKEALNVNTQVAEPVQNAGVIVDNDSSVSASDVTV